MCLALPNITSDMLRQANETNTLLDQMQQSIFQDSWMGNPTNASATKNEQDSIIAQL